MTVLKTLSFVIAFFNSLYGAEVIVNLMPQNNIFIGRDVFLDKMTSQAKNKDSILLLGSGGIGKTQIAKEYSWINESQYDFIWWVNAEQPIEPQSLVFAKKWNQVKKDSNIEISKNIDLVWKHVIQALSESKKRGLIIFDNFNNISDTVDGMKQFILNARHHQIIATARNMNLSQHFDQVNKVPVFTRGESISLFTKIYHKQNHTSENVNQLSELLKDYPLSIAQAATYLQSMPIVKIEDYLKGYQTKRKELYKANDTAVKTIRESWMDGYKSTTEITTTITLEQIQKESENAYHLVGFLSFLDNKNIPEEVVLKFFNNDAIKTSEAILKLMQYGMIEKDGTLNESTYSIHEILAEINRDRVNKNSRHQILLKCAYILNSLIPSCIDESISMLLAQNYYLNHINSVFVHSVKDKIFTNDLVNIKIRALEYYVTERRDKAKSQKEIEDINQLLENTPGILYLTQARFLLMKAAFSAWMLNDLDGSTQEAKAAEKLLKKIKEIDSEEQMMLYLRLSQNYSLQGDIDNTLYYTNLAEKLIQKDGDIKKHNVAVIYQARAVSLLDKGDLQESYFYINKAIETCPDQESKVMVIGFLVHKSKILFQDGHAKEMLILAETVQKKINQFLPHNNYFSHTPFIMKAGAFYHDGLFHEAESNIEKSIALLISTMNAKGNRRLAYAYRLSGDIAYMQNKKYKTIEEYLKAETMYQSSLKYQKIREVSDLYVNLVKIYFDTQQHFLAAEYRDKHENLFGIDDENSLEINLYINQKN